MPATKSSANRFRHVLRCDIYRYFPAIDHAILKRDPRRCLACARTLALADRIIDGSNRQEPVNLYYPGDDLFTPFERRRGLPIGNLTSQFFANVYLDGLDHFCKEVLRAKGYLRYVDDFVLFHDDPAQLAEWRRRIERFLEGRRLRLHPRKTWIAATSKPVTFLGFVLLPGGRRRLPEDNVRRFPNRLRGLRDRTGARHGLDLAHGWRPASPPWWRFHSRRIQVGGDEGVPALAMGGRPGVVPARFGRIHAPHPCQPSRPLHSW